MGNQLKSISPSPRPYKGMKTIIALAMLFSLTLAQAKFSLDMSKLETQVGTDKSHYGNPSGGCKSDEINGGVEGHDGVACLPDCTKRNCPTDLPDSQTTAKPQCAIVDFAHGKNYCVLQCKGVAKGKCPLGSKCTNTGNSAAICLYDPATASAMTLVDN